MLNDSLCVGTVLLLVPWQHLCLYSWILPTVRPNLLICNFWRARNPVVCFTIILLSILRHLVHPIIIESSSNHFLMSTMLLSWNDSLGLWWLSVIIWLSNIKAFCPVLCLAKFASSMDRGIFSPERPDVFSYHCCLRKRISLSCDLVV